MQQEAVGERNVLFDGLFDLGEVNFCLMDEAEKTHTGDFVDRKFLFFFVEVRTAEEKSLDEIHACGEGSISRRVGVDIVGNELCLFGGESFSDGSCCSMRHGREINADKTAVREERRACVEELETVKADFVTMLHIMPVDLCYLFRRGERGGKGDNCAVCRKDSEQVRAEEEFFGYVNETAPLVGQDMKYFSGEREQAVWGGRRKGWLCLIFFVDLDFGVVLGRCLRKRGKY